LCILKYLLFLMPLALLACRTSSASPSTPACVNSATFDGTQCPDGQVCVATSGAAARCMSPVVCTGTAQAPDLPSWSAAQSDCAHQVDTYGEPYPPAVVTNGCDGLVSYMVGSTASFGANVYDGKTGALVATIRTGSFDDWSCEGALSVSTSCFLTLLGPGTPCATWTPPATTLGVDASADASAE
jgi:hypothetical protein